MLFLTSLLTAGLTWAAPVPAARTFADTLLSVEDYLNLEQVGDPQISPDGKTIVYSRSWVDKVNDRWENAIWIVNADGTKNRFLTKGGGPVWSPDGTRIAYVGAGDDGKGAQIFVRWMDAEGATSQITRLQDGPQAVKWSPDGKWISFVGFVPKRVDWQIDMPPAPPNAKWTPAPRIVDRLHFRRDRQGFTETGSLHLFVVPADGGSPRQITSGDWSVGATFDGMFLGVTYEWSPDGKTILFDGLAEPHGDLAYTASNINAVDVATGTVRTLTHAPGFWSNPTLSPDGKLIAFAGHPEVKRVYQTSDLYVMNADGSNPRNLSRSFDRDIAAFGSGLLVWAPDGSGLYTAPSDRGAQNMVFFPLSGAPRPVTTGNHLLSVSSVSRTGQFAGTRTSFQAPTDVVTITLDKQKGTAQVAQVTHVNDDFLAGKWLASAEEIWYPSTNGAKIQGWIVKPPAFNPSKKYPLLLEIHGGPQGMYGVNFDMMWQVFAAQGYVVLFTNPRGSTGYGDAFVGAIERNYPGPDYDDLMAGVDTVVGRGYIDTKQMYVSGCSGGGALSSWVIGHTTRFAAAAVRCPVTNWISMEGTSDVPLFARNFYDKPFWEDPAPYLKHSSLMYVGNVTTPTLLMTGVLDMRTPMPQTEEFYAALKMRGIPTTLLRFEGEWHGTESVPSNWMRTMLYMNSWFKKYSGQTP